MASRAKQKGKKGEDEACEKLQRLMALDYLPQRNLRQTTYFGGDILLIREGFGIEVKRREVVDLQAWWNQIYFACRKFKTKDLEPIVMYRTNRAEWQYLISSTNIGIAPGWLHINETLFKVYVRRRLGVK